jgi:hypothetical protein
MVVVFRALDYYVPKPGDPSQELQLLKSIWGHFKPGVLTALMVTPCPNGPAHLAVLGSDRQRARDWGLPRPLKKWHWLHGHAAFCLSVCGL